MSQHDYKPAPRYLGKKLKEKLRVQLGNEKLLLEAPQIVKAALANGWIHPPKQRPMTDSQIHTFRFKNPYETHHTKANHKPKKA